LKICVLVKEVPDAAVEKRIDPSTGRMDRSGERNLNPYDTHAIEAAMALRYRGTFADWDRNDEAYRNAMQQIARQTGDATARDLAAEALLEHRDRDGGPGPRPRSGHGGRQGLNAVL